MNRPPAADDLPAVLARFAGEARHSAFHTGRYRLRFVTWGNGPPLVILHGLADVARSFAPVMARLADRYTCVAYELPNGLDDGAALGRYTHPHLVADLLALLDRLNLARTAVLGSSFGTTIVLAALAAAPDRFTRAVLQGGFARRPLRFWERRLALPARYWPGRFRDVPLVERVIRRLEQAAFQSAPDEVRRFFHDNHGETPIRAAALRALLLHRLDLRPTLPHIRTPVLMIGGDRDRIVPREYEAEVEAGLPDVRRVEFTPCGHYPQYTHPGPMADAIRAFLSEPVTPLKCAADPA
jgi:pimeloyl-ACP methyl ester carboxylesterase